MNSLNNTVSVLIPCRGECEFLNYTLESIVKSNLIPMEVIIVDDGISASAIDTINLFTHLLNIKVISNNGNGLVAALNIGLQNASGTYIARIDNDDIMHPNRLSQQIQILNTYAEIVAVGSNCEYIDLNGHHLGFSDYPVGRIDNLKNFNLKCLVAHPSATYRRSEALKIGGYRSIFTWDGTDMAEDFDFWLRLASSGHIINLEQRLIGYRQHQKQISSINLIGQQLASFYVSALAVANFEKFKRIEFHNGESAQLRDLYFICFKFLGLRAVISIKLRLRQQNLKQSSFLLGIQNKLINRIVSIIS